MKLKANLSSPESVKEVIAVQGNWSEARKEAMVYAYDLFAKWQGIKWEKPIYKAAKTLEDASSLVEAGFEYVCEIQDAKLFKKRK